MIVFENLSKSFPSTPHPVLNGVSFHVKPQTIHVFLGFSGAGKSVTLRHVLGLMKPDSGRVLVMGKDIATLGALELRELRKNFGMLFQGSALFDSLTVFENVSFPLLEHRRSEMTDDQIEDRVMELLKAVGLEEAREKLPAELSGGMQKRVGLARALALKPQLMLFDEPTTGLDPETSHLIDELIMNSVRQIGATAFIISHDVRAALHIADEISFLNQGKVIECSTPSQFSNSQNPVIQRFLKAAGVK